MQQPSILLVDNDSDSIETIQEFLESEGYLIRTALNPTDARHIMEDEKVALAIVDIRFINDHDDKDISGLTLAKEANQTFPKIILTRFPTYQAVREALGPALDGLPPAVSFVAKQEGLEALLSSIRLALLPLNPLLEANLLQAFQTSATLALPSRVKEVGPEEASRRLQQSFDATSAEITKYREQENRRASQYHISGLSAATLGMVFIFGSVVLIWLNYVTATVIPLIVSAISEAISALFFVREDAAYRRVNAYFAQLNDLNRIGNLLMICDSLETASDRDEYKKRIVDHIINRWLIQSP